MTPAPITLDADRIGDALQIWTTTRGVALLARLAAVAPAELRSGAQKPAAPSEVLLHQTLQAALCWRSRDITGASNALGDALSAATSLILQGVDTIQIQVGRAGRRALSADFMPTYQAVIDEVFAAVKEAIKAAARPTAEQYEH